MAQWIGEEVETDCIDLKPGDLSYAAGYFDGEGCITMFDDGPTPRLRIAIVSADKTVLALFGRLFHQRVYEVEHLKTNSRKQWGRYFRWSITGERAAEVLRDLEPLLIAKRKQAQLALSVEWSRLSGENREKVIAQRWDVKRQLSALKDTERGKESPTPVGTNIPIDGRKGCRT